MGAVFNVDESRILTWSGDDTAQLWDVKWANISSPKKEDFDLFCDTHLLGSLAKNNKGNDSPYIRLIDQEMIDKAPILRGRLGEDVCDIEAPPFYDKALHPLFNWIFRDGN